MAGFSLQLGYTSKKANSTSQVWNNTWTENVVLKEDTSIYKPVFIVDTNHTGSMKGAALDEHAINYAYCATFKRYYWVDDIVHARSSGIVEIHCTCDVLATWIKSIKNTTAFIKYTGNVAKRNGLLDDPRLQPEVPMKTSPTKVLTTVPGWATNASWVVEAEYWASNAGGFISYVFSDTNFVTFLKGVMNGWATVPGDVQTAIAMIMMRNGGMNSVTSFIKAIYAIPVAYASFTEQESDVWLGGYQLDASIKAKSYIDVTGIKERYEGSTNITIPYPSTGGIPTVAGVENAHPYFLRGAKYNSLIFKHPGGTLNIPLDSFINLAVPEITVNYCFGYNRGQYGFTFYNKEMNLLLGHCCGELRWDASQFISGGSGMEAAYMGGVKNIFGGAVKSLTGSDALSKGMDTFFYTKVEPATGSYEASNKNGASWRSSLLEMSGSHSFNTNMMFELYCTSSLPAVCNSSEYDAYAALQGYPCGKILKINDLGLFYVQCVEGKVELESSDPPPLSAERDAINQFLDSGIFVDT